MKGYITLIITLLSISSIISQKGHIVPQALKLKNHFGLPVAETKYGPKTDNIAQYVEANPETFTPMKYTGNLGIKKALEFKPYEGYESKLSPHQIKSGDMTNLAPSASQIISPEIAGPKLHLKAQITYPAVVGLPTFTGMKKEWHDVTAYNKQTGEIVHDKVLVSHPNIVRKDGVANIERVHEQMINLNNGQRIQLKDKTKKFFGTERQ
jgi:hypothetical protein